MHIFDFAIKQSIVGFPIYWTCNHKYIQQTAEDGPYWGNFTLQIDDEVITSFRSDSIVTEGTVYSITNEEVRPIAYFKHLSAAADWRYDYSNGLIQQRYSLQHPIQQSCHSSV